MKKLLAIALTSILMVSTIGITVHKHYCASSLVATSILPHGDDDTCDSTMPMDSHSCEDQHQQFSGDSPLVLVAVNFELAPSVTWIPAAESLLADLYNKDNSTTKFSAEIYPPPTEPNIYTKVQSFLL
jgi:hypothetical protein